MKTRYRPREWAETWRGGKPKMASNKNTREIQIALEGVEKKWREWTRN